MAELDLNLLRVFDAVMEAGSVTGAARRLRLSPPATSRALGRLRAAMNDPVLVRAGRTLVPTAYAQQTAARVRSLLEEADSLRRSVSSDPGTWRRTMTVRVNDGLAPTLTPKVMRLAAAEAPGVRLRFLSQDSKEPDLLRDGSLDLDAGIAVLSPPDIRSSPLFTERFVAVVRADSDLGRQASISVEDLATHPHISASRRGLARGPLDDALEATGRTRRVVATAPSYPVAALMTLEADVICLLPHRMTVHLVSRGLPLREHEVPLPLPTATIEQRWHLRADADPASRWLRQLLQAAARE